MFSHFYILSLHICQVCSSACFARFACFACFACFALNIEVLGEAYQGIAGCHLILAFNTFAHKKQRKCQRETRKKFWKLLLFCRIERIHPSITFCLLFIASYCPELTSIGVKFMNDFSLKPNKHLLHMNMRARQSIMSCLSFDMFAC